MNPTVSRGQNVTQQGPEERVCVCAEAQHGRRYMCRVPGFLNRHVTEPEGRHSLNIIVVTVFGLSERSVFVHKPKLDVQRLSGALGFNLPSNAEEKQGEETV